MTALRTALFAAFAATIAPAAAQVAAPPPPAPTAPLAIPNPTYITQNFEVTVNAPADKAWARVGRYCDLEEWLGSPCVITAGKEDELGAVRTIRGAVIEPMVAQTALSYTYTTGPRVGVPYNLLHGTLQAVAIDTTTSKIVYSFIWDTSSYTPEARDAEIKRRETRIPQALANIKQIIDSGKPRPVK